MRYLVTGAAGFIGSHVLLKLLNSGHEVKGIDSFSNYYPEDYKRARIKNLGIEECIIHLDLADKATVTRIFSAFNPEVVIHLAARPGVRANWSNLVDYDQNNIIAFNNLLDVVRRLGIPKFLFASSSSVYGTNQSFPLEETAEIGVPLSYYAGTKILNEMSGQLASGDNLSCIAMRFFTVYGPWGRPDMAILKFITSALSGAEVEVTADLNTKRDFTYIDDTVKTIIDLANLKAKKPFEVFNICGSKPRSLIELIRILMENSLDPYLSFEKRNVTDALITHGSTLKLQEFGLSVPSTSLEQGLSHTINWISDVGSESILLSLGINRNAL